MNIDLATLPLPTLASTTSDQRRRRVGTWMLGGRALRRFERTAAALGATSPAAWDDALASAARELRGAFAGSRRAPCIRLRLRCLAAMRAMSREDAWGLAPAQRERIASIADYRGGRERLVPDELPVVGGLDAAVLIDLAWPALRPELADYLDFRRLRAEEASMRGVAPHRFAFGRDEWMQARVAEHALIEHVHTCGFHRYAAPDASPLFRFHG